MSREKGQVNQPALFAGVVGQVGCITVIVIGLALGAGMLLDKYLGTNSIFTVLLMVGSVPVALYVTVRVSLTAAARIQDTSSSNEAEEETEA